MGITHIKFGLVTASEEGMQGEKVPRDLSHLYNVLFRLFHGCSLYHYLYFKPQGVNKMKKSFGL